MMPEVVVHIKAFVNWFPPIVALANGGIVEVSATDEGHLRVSASQGLHRIEDTIPCSGQGRPIVHSAYFAAEDVAHAVRMIVSHGVGHVHVSLNKGELEFNSHHRDGQQFTYLVLTDNYARASEEDEDNEQGADPQGGLFLSSGERN